LFTTARSTNPSLLVNCPATMAAGVADGEVAAAQQKVAGVHALFHVALTLSSAEVGDDEVGLLSAFRSVTRTALGAAPAAR